MKWAFILVILGIFLISCSQTIQVEEKEVSQHISVEVQKTETINNPKANCRNECKGDGCVDNDFYRCEIREDGCNYFVKVGPTLGKCDIGCFNDYDCNLNQDCVENITKFRTAYYCENVSKEMEEARLRMNASGQNFR